MTWLADNGLIYALNVMGISIPSGCRKFRVAVKPLFTLILGFGLPGLFCAILLIDGLNFDRIALAVASAAAIPIALVAAWSLSFLFPDALSPEGVYGHSFWGRRNFVRWQDITAVRSLRILNLRWLRVYSTIESKTTWLGLFQARRVEFRQEVQRLAPPGSPVLTCLR